MNTKLTLNIDHAVINKAKKYAKTKKRSVSKLVEEYLSSISSKEFAAVDNETLGTITKQIAGTITIRKKADCKELLSEALSEKYIWSQRGR